MTELLFMKDGMAMSDPQFEIQESRYLVLARGPNDPTLKWDDFKSSHRTVEEAVAAAKASLQHGNTEAQVGDLITGDVVFETAKP